MRTVSTILALVLFGPAAGADHVPVFKVENKVPPSFTVVNKTAPVEKPQTVPGVAPRPGEPVRKPEVSVLPRPFSDSMPGTIAPVKSGGTVGTNGVVWSSPQYTNSSGAFIHTGRVQYAGPNGHTTMLPRQACAGFV